MTFSKKITKLRSTGIRSERGQGLVEYLIIVAIVAVGALAITQTMGQTVKAQLARVTSTLQGKTPGNIEVDEVTDAQWKKRDMGDFMKGAVKRQ